MVDYLIRGTQLSIMIVTGNRLAGLLKTFFFFRKIGLPSHLKRQATGQVTRGQMRQSRMTTRREVWRVDTR
jgi:hypothetical protein